MQNQFNEDFINRVEKAAEKGAREGDKRDMILYRLIPLAVAVIIILFGVVLIKYSIEKKWNSFVQEFQEQLASGTSADSHDLVHEDDGVLGYTATDFADAVLGDSTQLKKVEVYEANISAAVTLTETGLANLNIFTKTQIVTFNGVATYTVDLSRLSKEDIFIDEENERVVIRIPHAECGTINIPSDEMEFGDTERGWLAFGDINMSAEQHASIETEAREKMEQRLMELNQAETADRFAVMTVWEMYQPVISSVSPQYKLEIVF